MRAARAGTIGVLLLPAARAGTISVLSPAAGAQSGARCVNVAQVGAVAVALCTCHVTQKSPTRRRFREQTFWRFAAW